MNVSVRTLIELLRVQFIFRKKKYFKDCRTYWWLTVIWIQKYLMVRE